MSNSYRLQSFVLTSLLSVVAMFALPGIANGQVPFDAMNPFGQTEDPEVSQKKKFETRLRVRIDEMKRVCELTDKQVGQLQTGAKGTVIRSMKVWKQQARALQNRLGAAMPGVVPPGDVADEEGDEDEDDDEEEEDAGPPINAQIFRMMTQMMLGEIPPERNKVWKNVVRKVLTDAQRTQLEESDNARRAFNRRTGVMNNVQTLDTMLRFSQSQRQKVIEVVDRVLGKTLERDQAPSVGQTTLVYGDEARLLPKHLKGILSPAQLQAFEASEKASTNPMAAAIQMGMGGRGPRRVSPIPGAKPGGCYLGASFATNPLGLPEAGTTIHQIVPDGPADKAGLRPGDLLKKFGGSDVGDTMTFLTSLRKFEPGQEVKVVFERDGEEMTATMKLTKRD